MTRDALMVAVNQVFGVRVWAIDRFWNVQVESDPPREILFSGRFVQAHVENKGMSPRTLERLLRETPANKWIKDGRALRLLVRAAD